MGITPTRHRRRTVSRPSAKRTSQEPHFGTASCLTMRIWERMRSVTSIGLRLVSSLRRSWRGIPSARRTRPDSN